MFFGTEGVNIFFLNFFFVCSELLFTTLFDGPTNTLTHTIELIKKHTEIKQKSLPFASA
jgi:hypothetical protein